MNNLRQRKAFTIVEMVIVIAVIAILAAVLIPTISTVIEKANVSADQQFAASLNVQLALWEVDNGTIKDESDLRDAINYYYGEWEDEEKTVLKEGGDFYATLAPKSGKYGHHFWYDAENRQVIVSTYDKLEETAVSALMVDAAGEEEPKEPAKFSIESPRSIWVEGKNYFLMDQSGSDIGDKLKALASITSNAEYAELVVKIEALTGETDLITAVVSKLKTTAVANESGVFFAEDWDKATEVYIPFIVKSIGASKVPAGKFDITKICLPSSIKTLDTSSFVIGDKSEGLDYNETVVIYWNIKANANQLGKIVSTDAFNVILELSDGSRWAFVKSVLTNLKTNETVTTDFSTNLKQFDIASEADDTYDLHFSRSEDGILHITGDTSEIKLIASNFIDENENRVNRSVSWKIGEDTTIGANVYISDVTNLKTGDIITVTAQNITYKIKVVKVGIQNFEVKIDGDTGEPFGGDGVTVYENTLYYENGSTWKITPVVTPFGGCGTIQLSTGFTHTIDGSGKDYIEIINNSLKIKGEPTGTFEAEITFTTEAKNADGSKLSIKFKLTFEEASSPFVYADNANTYEKYGEGHEFTIGNKNSIELGTLFDVAPGKTVNGDKIKEVLQKTSPDSNGGNNILTKSGSDWKKWTITPVLNSGDVQRVLYIAISDGGAPCVLQVIVVNNAYNVATLDQWKSASGKICLLADIDLGAVIVDNDNNTNYAKAVTYLNGNYHKIDATEYVSKTYSGSYYNGKLLSVSGGTIENLVIDGPIYPKAWTAAGTNKGSSNGNGQNVASGIIMTGTSTVKNSYISGFSSPIRVNGGTATLQDSVLDGGAKANLYANSATMTINFIDMTTVQRRGGYKSSLIGSGETVIGSSLYIDEKAVATITFSGDTRQYNWVTKSDGSTYSGQVKTIIDKLFSGDTDCETGTTTYDYPEFIHTVDGSDYINMGIAKEKNTSDWTVNAYTGTYAGTLNKVLSTSSFAVYSYECYDGCVHKLNPDDLTGDGVYTYLDFIAGRKVN